MHSAQTAEIETLCLPVGFEADDEMSYPLLERHWPEARDALLVAREHLGGRALVHCAMGVACNYWLIC